MSRGDRRDITIKCSFSGKLDGGANGFHHNLHFACKQHRAKNTTTPQRRSQRAYKPQQTRVKMGGKIERQNKKVGVFFKNPKEKDMLKKKDFRGMQGDGSDGIPWDVAFHETLGAKIKQLAAVLQL